MKGLFVTGTDTNVGKTWVGKRLIEELCKRGIKVTPRKPIESGWDENNIYSTDAWILANAANMTSDLDSICPNRFHHPISPVRAAVLVGQQLSIKSIKEQCLKGVADNHFLYVEGAGGFYSPLCADGLNADLAESLNLPILLVAENRLGCINQVLLNVEAIEAQGLTLKAIVLNMPSCQDNIAHPKNMNNHEDIKNLVGYPIISISHRQHTQTNDSFKELASLIVPPNLGNKDS